MAATTWLLLNEGYAATTLEAVARRAGMAKKTVYRYASDREDLVAQVVRGWTDGFAPVMAQDVTSVDEVLPALARVLQAIAERVLSADAVGMFRLLTADFPGRDAAAGLPGERHRTRHGHVGRLVPAPARRGLIQVSEPRVVAGLLLSMAIAEPLRAMALGLTPPLPESSIGERIQACLALFAGDARSSRCAPRDAVRAPFSLPQGRRGDLAKRAHGDTLNRQRRVHEMRRRHFL